MIEQFKHCRINIIIHKKKMNRAPTSIFVPPIRRESQHGSGVRRAKRKRKNKKTRRKIKKKKSANLVSNLKKIIQRMQAVKRR